MTERVGQERNVIWAGNVASNEIGLRPGATFSIDLPSTFVGTTLTIQAYSELSGTWKDITDPDAALPLAVTANKVNILPPSLYLSGLDRVRFVSDAAETCTGRLLVSL